MPKGMPYNKTSAPKGSTKVPAKSAGKPAAVPSKTEPPGYGKSKKGY